MKNKTLYFRTFRKLMAVFSCLITFSAHATDLQPRLISGAAMAAIAKDSVAIEINELNSELANPTAQTNHYPKAELKKFIAQTRLNSISAEELNQKCMLSQADIIHLSSNELSPEFDASLAKIKSLETVGALYGKNTWRLFTRACRFAQTRFEHRLSSLQSHGSDLNLESEKIANLSSILFFPTVIGAAPSKAKDALMTAFNTSIFGAMIFGPAAALGAIAVGTPFVMVATATSSSGGLLSEVLSHFKKSLSEKLAKLLSQSPVEVEIDLTLDESQQLQP